MASTYLTKTFSGAGNRKTWTMSAWIKRSALASSSDIRVFGWKSGGGNYGFQFDSDKFRFYLVAGGSGSEFLTNRVFRDTNAWYHIVAKCDTTQSTASDRFKLYINGVLETSFSTATYPNQNEDTAINQAEVCRLGCNTVAVNSHFDGLMSHVHFTDGYAYDASAFGSTDSTTGEWKINTSPSVTYGTNGFFLLKNDNAVTDRSGQGNNFTLGAGTLTPTQDNPSNIFATLNRLDNFYANSSFANGNTYLNTSTSNYTFNNATLGYSKGKFYWEIKITQNSGYDHLGITSKGSTATSNYMYDSDHSYVLKQSGVLKENTGSGQQTVSGFSGTSYATDIIGIAHDCDNNKIYFHKNGTYMNSANPNTPTGGITTTAASATDTGVWLPAFGDEYNSGASIYLVNFGNGYFGTTAVSSAGTNASNIGIFEYDVPTGFTALSTKGLNE